MSGPLQDLRYAVRPRGQSAAFTAAALAPLGLGIGADTWIFIVIHSVLPQPLPFPARRASSVDPMVTLRYQ